MEPTSTPRRKRRTNAEILADMKAERELLQTKPKRKRRTKAEMERDRRRTADAQLKKELAEALLCKVVTFFDEVNAFGKLWISGEEVKLTPGSYYHSLAFDAKNDFILAKSPEEQLKLWGKVKYRVREEPV